MYDSDFRGIRVSGYQGIRESCLNLGRPLARGATILGTQDKEYIIHKEKCEFLRNCGMIQKIIKELFDEPG